MKQVTVNNDGTYTWGVEIPFGGNGESGGANADTLINTTDNSKTLGWVVDTTVSNKTITDCFSYSDVSGLSIKTDMIPVVDPKTQGAFWNNGGFLAISNG